MNNTDFSNGFDTLVNSFASKIPFGDQVNKADIAFDEYEKSFFLTKAQEELVVGFYTGRNSYGEAFETTEEMRRYLSDLIVEEVLEPICNTAGFILGMDWGTKSKFFTLPKDIWFITYEAVKILYPEHHRCGESGTLEVVPIRQDEYNRIRKNPFRGPNNRRALRLDLSEGVVEIISNFVIEGYYLRYLRKLNPIVLTDMPEDVTVDNVGVPSPCELHESLHQRILERAVMLALQSKGYKIDNK